MLVKMFLCDRLYWTNLMELAGDHLSFRVQENWSSGTGGDPVGVDPVE